MLYNIRWNTSQTKQIYQATKNSEILMEYLEECLLREDIAKLIGEAPSPKRGYGVLIFYYSTKPKRILLSAAPRRNKDYIHVVLFNNISNREELQRLHFITGNSQEPVDVKISSKVDIDKLVALIKVRLQLI